MVLIACLRLVNQYYSSLIPQIQPNHHPQPGPFLVKPVAAVTVQQGIGTNTNAGGKAVTANEKSHSLLPYKTIIFFGHQPVGHRWVYGRGA